MWLAGSGSPVRSLDSRGTSLALLRLPRAQPQGAANDDDDDDDAENSIDLMGMAWHGMRHLQRGLVFVREGLRGMLSIASTNAKIYNPFLPTKTPLLSTPREHNVLGSHSTSLPISSLSSLIFPL